MKKAFLAAFFAFMLLSFPLFAQSSAEKSRLDKEISILENQLKENSSKTASAQTKLDLTRAKIEIQKKAVSNTTSKISALDRKITDAQRKINRTQAQLDTMEVYYARLVRSAYKNRDPRIWYMYLLSGKNLSQNIRRFNYLRNLSGSMQHQAELISAQKDSLQSMKAALQKDKAAQKALLQDKKAQLGELQKTESSQKQAIDQLKKESGKYQQQIAQKRKQAEELRKKAEQMTASAAAGKGAAASAKKSTKKSVSSMGKDFGSQMGKLPWPVEGPVVEKYGQHNHPVYKNVKLPFNNGVNIATANGAKVRCVYEGEVKQVVVMPGYNQCVLVQHGEYFTFYCKLGSVGVKAGDKVSGGTIIGTVDKMGGSSQLHFQVWKGKKAQNPEVWLQKK